MTFADHRTHGILTFEAFLAFADGRPEGERWELRDGVPAMMTPPAKPHQLIVSNVTYELMAEARRARADWLVVTGAGVHVPGLGANATTPDVTITFHSGYDGSFAHQPIVLVEILSRSTRRSDLGWKKAHYIEIPSLEHYLILDQERPRAVVFSRAEGWREQVFRGGETGIPLRAIATNLTLSELYRSLDPHRATRL